MVKIKMLSHYKNIFNPSHFNNKIMLVHYKLRTDTITVLDIHLKEKEF